jgi:pimeloyl-ACP methyl ester carboxylesterase
MAKVAQLVYSLQGKRMTEAIFKLRDHRKLSYAIYGPQTGRPVLYFHGTPSSRLEPLLLKVYGVDLDALLDKAGLKLIAIDRPGMGLSTFNPNGNFLSFCDDARELCDHLGIKACPVLSWSGGGPYSLAIAFRHPQLIRSVHIICGFTRQFDRDVMRQMGLNKWYFLFARNVPVALRLGLKIARNMKTKHSVPQQLTGLPYEDYVFLKDPENMEAVSSLTMKQACRLGSKGPVREAGNYYKALGFELSSITQPVHYWWGTKDQTVIKMHPESIEMEVQNQVMHYRDQEGHLSVYVHSFHEVLQNISSHY